MATFASEKTKIRRYLRDIDGDIWSDDDIRTYWNDAQHEIAMRANYKERVHTYKFPPEWTFAYMNDWENTHADGDKYQCLIYLQANGKIICYPWEANYWLDNNETPDDGYRFTQPWEGTYASPADVLEIPLHKKFEAMKYCAYDEDELRPITQRELSDIDQFYRTVSGTAVFYWRPDEYRNTFVIYPRPSNPTYDDDGLRNSPDDSFDDSGGINNWTEADLDEVDAGIITEQIDTSGQIFMVFDAIPNDVGEDDGDWFEELDIPDFLVKYIRYATLERCFGADTDGFIPTLRDYWAMRKEVGINAIKKFLFMKKSDRNYRLGEKLGRRLYRHPRLPAGYPAI